MIMCIKLTKFQIINTLNTFRADTRLQGYGVMGQSYTNKATFASFFEGKI